MGTFHGIQRSTFSSIYFLSETPRTFSNHVRFSFYGLYKNMFIPLDYISTSVSVLDMENHVKREVKKMHG